MSYLDSISISLREFNAAEAEFARDVQRVAAALEPLFVEGYVFCGVDPKTPPGRLAQWARQDAAALAARALSLWFSHRHHRPDLGAGASAVRAAVRALHRESWIGEQVAVRAWGGRVAATLAKELQADLAGGKRDKNGR